MDSTDVLADLPAPFDGEPESVRKDIADELADHLACAYRRELLLTADDQTARRNVLHKFGDPRRIARQLWFQALWGRIMLAKLKLAVPWFKFAAVIVFAWSWLMVMEQVTIMRNYSVTMAQQSASLQNQAMHQQALLQQVLQRLPPPTHPHEVTGYADPISGSGGAAMVPDIASPADSFPVTKPANDTVPPGGFLLKLVDTQAPPQPVQGCVLALVREDGSRVPTSPRPWVPESIMTMGMSGGASVSGGGFGPSVPTMLQCAQPGLTVVDQDQGRVRFPTVEPGRYHLFIEFPDGRMCDHRLVIAPDASPEARQLTIACPAADKLPQAYVVFEMPPLLKDSRERLQLQAEVLLEPVLQPADQIEWQNSRNSRRLTLHFDPVTGVVTHYARWKPEFSTSAVPFRLQGESALPDVYLGDVQREERFIAVPSGCYRAVITLQLPGSEPLFIKFETIQVVGDTDDGVLTITPETKTFKFEGPPGWQEKLFKKLGIKPEITPSDASSEGVSATNGRETKPAPPSDPELTPDPK